MPVPPFLIPNRVPHGFTQDPSTDLIPVARGGAAGLPCSLRDILEPPGDDLVVPPKGRK